MERFGQQLPRRASAALPSAAGRVAALVIALSASLAAETLPYQNPGLAPEVRAADLVSRMTLAEKVSQMQTSAAAIPRLGVPYYNWWSEALHGVARAGLATSFPQAIGLAATWDTALMETVGDAISTEARAKFHQSQRQGIASVYRGLTFFSPNINLVRDPRWGRGQETYGEDPYLTGATASAFIRGMQGTDPHYLKTIATSKHFAVHSGPEPARHSFNAAVSEQDLVNSYLAAFRTTVQSAGAGSLMCAYNAVNGVPACASTDLLQTRLRDAWGFTGYVVSDCGAIGDIANGHHYAPGIPEASALAVRAGADLTCGTEYAQLTTAVSRGLITEAEIDRAAVRLFTARFRLGMFDPPERVPYTGIPYSAVDSQANRDLALLAAEKSIVLLKNANGTLPLAADIKKIAVAGPAADWPDMQLGNYYGTPSHIVTPLAGIRQRFGATAEVRYAAGSPYVASFPTLVPAEALRTPDGAAGLRAEYFPTNSVAGSPSVTRVEPHVYFDRDSEDPEIAAAIPRDHFAVRWTGSLTAPYTGAYSIGLWAHDCTDCSSSGSYSRRVYLDGQLLSGTVQLTAGSSHPLRIEYAQDRSNKSVEFTWVPPADQMLAEAQAVMAESDVTLLFLGLNATLEDEQSSLSVPGFLKGDRTDIALPEPQQRLLRAALDVGKPVIVVLTTGSAIVAAGAEEEAAAVLEAWYPGQEGGTAIARVLAGDYNPSGRLPITFYRSVDQLPPFEDYAMAGRTYRYFTGQALYRFGYGLSYSRFRYSRAVSRRARAAGAPATVSVNVTNISDRDGDEVVQLYVAAGGGSPTLAAFRRVHIPARQSLQVEFMLDPGALPPGPITVWAGGGPPPATQ